MCASLQQDAVVPARDEDVAFAIAMHSDSDQSCELLSFAADFLVRSRHPSAIDFMASRPPYFHGALSRLGTARHLAQLLAFASPEVYDVSSSGLPTWAFLNEPEAITYFGLAKAGALTDRLSKSEAFKLAYPLWLAGAGEERSLSKRWDAVLARDVRSAIEQILLRERQFVELKVLNEIRDLKPLRFVDESGWYIDNGSSYRMFSVDSTELRKCAEEEIDKRIREGTLAPDE